MADGSRRFVLEISDDGDTLALVFREGKTSRSEELCEGVVLERSSEDRALRLVVNGLREEWESNVFLSPAITCVSGKGEQLVAPDGTRMFMLGACGPAKRHPIYHDA